MSLEVASTHAVQVIDEEKEFQQQSINEYVKNVIKVDLGLHYHVISVFGSQSTGKSTLLNNLFHTNFDVMNETKRQQTTKGIWLGYTSTIESTTTNHKDEKILVMDVEGSDGRERGEDQDFERKAALFALSTSEVLIVNIWEHQVGLYQGANMGLLKTVFEVNLSLFGNQNHKVLLLFVIRDHIGNTPLENLSNTLTQDLTKMWESISKPSTVNQDVKLTDYFDLQFTTLAHKVLQPEEFKLNIKQLGDKFIDSSNPEYVFKTEYQQNFPIDGWTLYANNCWDQIQSNKDLDLPTQQILVARFRCDEIAKESLAAFNDVFKEKLANVKYNEITGVDLSSILTGLYDLGLNDYDSHASHYNKSVYQARRKTLQDDILNKLKTVYQEYLKELNKISLSKFKSLITDKSNKSTFLVRSKAAQEETLSFFTKSIEPFKIFESINKNEFSNDLEQFKTQLTEELNNLRELEVTNLTSRLIKRFNTSIKNDTLELFSDPNELLWDNILQSFNHTLDSALSRYEVDSDVYDFRLGSSDGENKDIVAKIKKSAWASFDQFIHEYLREDNILNILRKEFENKFAYDSNNIPRVWKTEIEITKVYQEATEATLKSLPIFAIAKLSNGTEIIPDYDNEDDDEEDDEPHRFAHILSAPQQLKIKQQFLKIAEISYRDANRSIIANITKIPPFIYILLIVLGWNEFMAILRNPLYLVLTILIGTGLFFVNTLNLWGPLNTASQIFIQQGKEWLASALLDQPQRVPPVSSGFKNTEEKYTENIELSDLSKED